MKRRASLFATVVMLLTTLASSPARGSMQPLTVSSNGLSGEVVGEGVGCPAGTLDATSHWTAHASVAAGDFTPATSSLTIELQILTGATAAALRGADSIVVLSDDVGSVTLELSSGDCENPTLVYDGTTISGSGTWRVASEETSTNAYRGAVGAGTFNLSAQIVPGIDTNAWTLALDGVIDGTTCTVDARGATSGETLTGTDGADKICGSRFDDSIEALGGGDQVYAGSGADAIRGNAGDDSIAGGAGDDVVLARPGLDYVHGGDGFDRCVAQMTESCERGAPD